MAIHQSIKEQQAKLNDKSLEWWTFIYRFVDNTIKEQIFLNKINDELNENYKSSSFHGLSSIREVGYIIGTWLDKIRDERKSLEKWFEKVQFFADNLKRRQQLDVDIFNKIENLIRSAFECHLNQLPDDTNDRQV